MKRTATLRPRWILTSWLLLGFVPLFVAGFFFVVWQTAALRERARREAIEVSMHVARLVNVTAGVERARLQALGFNEPFAQATARRELDTIRQALRFVEFDRNWQGVFLFSAAGDAVAAVGRISEAEIESGLDLDSEILLPAGGDIAPRMIVRLPVVLDGEIVGRLLGILLLSDVEQAIGTSTAGSGTTLLVDRTGLVLAGSEPLVNQRISLPEAVHGELELPSDSERYPVAIQYALDGAVRVVSFRPPIHMTTVLLPVAVVFTAVGLFLSALVINARVRLSASEAGSIRRERELRAVYELALDATQQAERDRFLRMACSRAAGLVQGVTASVVALTSLEPDRILIHRGFPEPHPEPASPDLSCNPMLARALNHGRRECGQQELRSEEWSDILGSHSWECWTPLVAHGRVLGALGILGSKSNGELTTEEAVLLDSFAATLAMALESQDRLSRLTHQGAMLATVLDSSPDAIAALSAEDRICLENPAFRQLLRIENPLAGRSLADAIAEFTRAGGRFEIDFDPGELIRQARQGATTRGSFRIIYGAESRLVESVMAPLTLPSGEGGTLLSLRDVSQREELDEVRRLHRRVASLAESAANRAALLDKVLASSELGIVFIGRDERVQYANELFATLVGIPRPGRSTKLSDLESALTERLGTTFEQLRTAGEVQAESPERRVMEVRCVDVLGEDGIPLGRLLTLRDVTDRHTLDAAREAFIGVAAHELKNPVAALRLQTEMAIRSEGPRQQRALERVVVRATELQELVERLLDITRADLGKLEMERAPLNLSHLARTAVDQLVMAGNPVRLTDSCHDDTSCVAFADPIRARQALDNLLSNAIRYGGDKGVDVRVAGEGNEVILEVRDQGPGIPQAEQDTIFGRFGQGSSGTRGPGLGVGLYLAKRIAEAHGGRIELESTVGVGSTFRLVFPTATVAMQSAPSPLIPPSSEPRPPMA